MSPSTTTPRLAIRRPVDGGTEVILIHEGLPTEEAARQHSEGWGEILRRLGERRWQE
jgi:Activator of Hsp90 ATPase homolog 1-like protein